MVVSQEEGESVTQGNEKKVTLRSSLYFVLVVLSLGGILYFVLLPEDGISRKKRSETPSVEAHDVQKVIFRKDGHKVWEFSADSISMSSDHKYATAIGIKQAILYRDNKPYVKLKAQKVRLNQHTYNAEATGKVEATSPNGVVIHTTSAFWLHQTKQLHCPFNVLATVRDVVVESKNVWYDTEREILRCKQQVKLTSPQANLQTAEATVDVRKQLVSMNGGTEVILNRASLGTLKLPDFPQAE